MDKKQELLKLIHNLDWGKFVDLACSDLSVHAYIVALLTDNQKEKTIEQKLEELGFVESKFNQESKLLFYYTDENNRINLGFKINPEYYQALFNKYNHNKILTFANYLITLKNGANQ